LAKVCQEKKNISIEASARKGTSSVDSEDEQDLAKN